MKTLGMLGGMSWESTVLYYQIMNRRVREVVGGFHSLPCIIHSVDLAQIVELQEKGDWETASRLLADAASGLKAAGAQGIMLCCNTMHIAAPTIEDQTQLPLLHIVDVTAQAVMKAGFSRPVLLGTRYTMEMKYFREKLEKDFGMQVLLPNQSGRDEIHRIIFTELVNGVVRPESRAKMVQIIKDLVDQGGQCLILGCTELIMLLSQDDVSVPIFDTTAVHAEFAVDWAISSQ